MLDGQINNSHFRWKDHDTLHDLWVKLLILDSNWSKEDSNLGEGTTTYEMESEILGYHVYFKSWKPKVIDVLSTDHAHINANRI